MKSAHEIAVERSDDQMILLRNVTESGKHYYSVGQKVTVVWYGSDRYVCLTCHVNLCCHTERVRRLREDAA